MGEDSEVFISLHANHLRGAVGAWVDPQAEMHFPIYYLVWGWNLTDLHKV